MGHDIHFLERLSRVNAEQVELALGLYRDPALLRGLLARFAPGAGRAAIALENGREPPYLVVAADGHLVTCLGPGMHPTGLRVISRRSVDFARARQAADRLAAERGGVQALEEALFHDAHRLEREVFEALLALRPLTPARARLGELFSGVRPLAELRRSSLELPRLKEGLDGIWAAESTLSCDWLLAASAGRLELDEVNALLRSDRWAPAACVELATSMRASVAVRLAWGVGRLGTPYLAAFAELAEQAATWPQALAAGFGLAALALAKPSLRAQALEALREGLAAERPGRQPEAADLRAALVAAVEALVADPVEATGRALARGQAACVRLGRRLAPGSAFLFGRPEDVPPELALCVAANLPEARVGDAAGVGEALDLLPWALARQAPALFLTREARVLLPAWEPGFTQGALAALRRCTARPAARAEALPGRNDRCPCGSGQKFKRCCAAAPRRAA